MQEQVNDSVIIHLARSRKRRSLDTVKCCKVQSYKVFQIIMLAVMPVKSGLRSYGGLQKKFNFYEIQKW